MDPKRWEMNRRSRSRKKGNLSRSPGGDQRRTQDQEEKTSADVLATNRRGSKKEKKISAEPEEGWSKQNQRGEENLRRDRNMWSTRLSIYLSWLVQQRNYSADNEKENRRKQEDFRRRDRNTMWFALIREAKRRRRRRRKKAMWCARLLQGRETRDWEQTRWLPPAVT